MWEGSRFFRFKVSFTHKSQEGDFSLLIPVLKARESGQSNRRLRKFSNCRFRQPKTLISLKFPSTGLCIDEHRFLKKRRLDYGFNGYSMLISDGRNSSGVSSSANKSSFASGIHMKDNVGNQREHIVLLLANEQSQLCIPDQLEPKMEEAAVQKVFLKSLENYIKWCNYLSHLPLQPVWNNLETVSKEKKLLWVSLYYLIWGEAANIRFLPECLCYIFHHMEFRKSQQKMVKAFRTRMGARIVRVN